MTQLMLTNSLNDIYRKAYTEIAMSDSDFYVKNYKLTEFDLVDDLDDDPDGWYELPDDCFIVKSVTIGNNELTRCPPKEKVPGTYVIQNTKIKFYGDTQDGITLHYIPNPQTVTCPAESQRIEIPEDIVKTITEFGKQTSEGFYYKTIDNSYFYSFETKTNETAPFQKQTYRYENDLGQGTLEWGEDYIHLVDENGELVEDLTEDFDVGEYNKIKKVVVDDPYMMITYESGEIFIVQNGIQTAWNINDASGHKTLGIVHSLKTDDRTLYGCVYEDLDGQLYYSSFVPDTVMNYPTNALFLLIEIELANLLMSMNGINNEYISVTLREETVEQFRKELIQNRASPVRINNQRLRAKIFPR